MASRIAEYSLLESDDREEFLRVLTDLTIRGSWCCEGNLCVTWVPAPPREPEREANPLEGHFHYTQLLGMYYPY